MNSQVTQMPVIIPGYRHIQDAQLIIRLEGSGNYTIAHLSTHRTPLLISQTLKRFDEQLPGFIRISKSMLVNPYYIDEVIQENTTLMHLKLINGIWLRVSRRRMSDTLIRLGQ